MEKPDILYEQYRLNELDPFTKKALEDDPRLSGKIEVLEKDDKAILEQYPPVFMAKQIEARRKTVVNTRIRRITVRYILPSAAAAAFCLFLIFSLADFFPSRHTDPGYSPLTGTEDTRVKGDSLPVMRIYRQQNGKVEELSSVSTAAAGDRLQLSYFTPVRQYGAIFSLDGNGYLTLHYPDKGSETALLEGGGENYLPTGYELDDAPAFERFYFFHSSVSLRLSDLAGLIKAYRPEDLDRELRKLTGNNGEAGVSFIHITKR